ENYYPHFLLGAAYVNLGKCAEAMKAFEESRSQGAIRTNPKYADLLEGMKSCEGQVAKGATPPPSAPPPTRPAGPDPTMVAQAVQAAEAAIARGDATAGQLGQLATDPLLSGLWNREPGLGAAETAAREALAAARGKVAAGRRASDLGQLEEAREMAAKAEQQLEGVRRDALRRRDALVAANKNTTPP